MIIVCPYCYQHIETNDKEKNHDSMQIKCPKCKLNFNLDVLKNKTYKIESELYNSSTNNSCCVESSWY